MGRRRGRKGKQFEEVVQVLRFNTDTERDQVIHEELVATIKPATSADTTEPGGVIQLDNAYVAFITPPLDNINPGDKFIRHRNNVTMPQQTLTVQKEEQGLEIQRVFLRDLNQRFQ